MANRQTLALTRYVRPSTIIGKVYNPKVVNTGMFPRIPTYIGKGVPYLVAENLELIRAFIRRERLTFPASAPFEAGLANPSTGSQLPKGLTEIQVYNSRDEVVEAKGWKFVKSSPTGPYDTVQILTDYYNPSDTYYIDYQSTDADVYDYLPIAGLRSIKFVGDREFEDVYKAGQDFEMVTSISTPAANADNTGTGVVTINAAAKFTGWNRNYVLTVEDVDIIPTPTLGVISQTAGTGTGTAALNPATLYTGIAPLTWTLTVANLVTNLGVTTLDLDWSDGTNTGTIVGVSSATPTNVLITAGIRINLTNMDQMVNGDVFTLPATVLNVNHVEFSWYSDDYQANSGLFDIFSNQTTIGIGIESGILLDFSVLSGFALGDKWSIAAVNHDALNWNFLRTTTEDITPSDIYYDALGTVTGIPRSYYITLGHIPDGAIALTRVDTGLPVTHSAVVGTPYVRLTTTSVVNLRAVYQYHFAPSAGQTYYATVTYTRPESMYNVPLVYTGYKDCRDEIGYPAADNHIAIMADYAFNVTRNSIVAVIQIKDADHDGVYNVADYREGLQASYRRKDLTDISVLGKFETLADQMYNSQEANDPLYAALRLFWMGYPNNYEVGDPETPDTIAYTSSKILQYSGGNPARGSLISCANPWVVRTVIQQNGVATQLTLDGSFFAGMVMSIETSYSDPNTLMVNQVVPGIDDCATFDDTEVTILGQASNLYALKPSPKSPVVKIIDAVTTDTSEQNNHEINVMVVKQLVTKRVISDCDTALIGYVPRNVDDGIRHVRGVINRSLQALIGENIISDYTDSDGRPREIREEDVDVWRDETDKTRYNFNYWFNGRYGIKRLVGLYAVDENVFLSNS